MLMHLCDTLRDRLLLALIIVDRLRCKPIETGPCSQSTCDQFFETPSSDLSRVNARSRPGCGQTLRPLGDIVGSEVAADFGPTGSVGRRRALQSRPLHITHAGSRRQECMRYGAGAVTQGSKPQASKPRTKNYEPGTFSADPRLHYALLIAAISRGWQSPGVYSESSTLPRHFRFPHSPFRLPSHPSPISAIASSGILKFEATLCTSSWSSSFCIRFKTLRAVSASRSTVEVGIRVI
jgi:hypothetical protein